jgi:hypothetical protein
MQSCMQCVPPCERSIALLVRKWQRVGVQVDAHIEWLGARSVLGKCCYARKFTASGPA